MGTDREEVDPFDTLKTEPSGARPSEPPRLPPVLVQLLCAEDLRAPSARHWLEDCTELRIRRGNLMLSGFNGVAHLELAGDPSLLTYR